MPEIKEKFELLKNYLDEIPIGIMLLGKEKKLLSWNKFALKILEVSEEEFNKEDF